MDYMVFLTSRIREEHVNGLNTQDAVDHGIAAIGRVVVAAAIIMATVFSAFIVTPDRISKEFGLLLAVAILTDARVVKLTFLPAFFTLMGERTWYIRAGSTGSSRTSRSSLRTTARNPSPCLRGARSRARRRASAMTFAVVAGLNPDSDDRERTAMTLDTRSRWLALLVVCLGDLMIVLDVTIVGWRCRRFARTLVLGDVARVGRERLPPDVRRLPPPRRALGDLFGNAGTSSSGSPSSRPRRSRAGSRARRRRS